MNADYSLALGYGATVSSGATDAVALGANSVADIANTISVGFVGGERQIVNVFAGALSATSTDAVNGSQLYQTNLNVGNNTQIAINTAPSPRTPP